MTHLQLHRLQGATATHVATLDIPEGYVDEGTINHISCGAELVPGQDGLVVIVAVEQVVSLASRFSELRADAAPYLVSSGFSRFPNSSESYTPRTTIWNRIMCACTLYLGCEFPAACLFHPPES